MKRKFTALAGTAILFAAPVFMAAAPNTTLSPLEDRVRHELATQPYLTLFDDVSFRVDGSVVTLVGSVREPWLSSRAESAVKHIEGVTKVNNQIDVLPLSPFDNQIRWNTYRAIFGYPALQRYAQGVIPTIHIIVKNGNVTLDGKVSTEQDKQLAYTRARLVPGVFSVTNDLQVAP